MENAGGHTVPSRDQNSREMKAVMKAYDEFLRMMTENERAKYYSLTRNQMDAIYNLSKDSIYNVMIYSYFFGFKRGMKYRQTTE